MSEECSTLCALGEECSVTHNGKCAALSEANRRIEKLEPALTEAAQSLETIGELAGKITPTDLLQHTDDIRAYARNRALPARAALEQGES